MGFSATKLGTSLISQIGIPSVKFKCKPKFITILSCLIFSTVLLKLQPLTNIDEDLIIFNLFNSNIPLSRSLQ